RNHRDTAGLWHVSHGKSQWARLVFRIQAGSFTSRAGERGHWKVALIQPVYCPVAAWYCCRTVAGTRPRSLMAMPCSLAQARTATVSAELALRLLRAVPLRAPATLRAWVTYCPSAERS